MTAIDGTILPPIRFRAGISYGRAIVGNIGSEDRVSYTAMGDTVNLASRLEAINKYYGTYLCIADTAYE
ncbi:adenylate/guanylate cyclase domain-containing protein [Candidatus Peregrinibacteria bacterium]|nr:adenylate/guanylate cyclase domain-containing protein [Candidatus Peregrinibacteria bacterium]